jgi:hypothetical protein
MLMGMFKRYMMCIKPLAWLLEQGKQWEEEGRGGGRGGKRREEKKEEEEEDYHGDDNDYFICKKIK